MLFYRNMRALYPPARLWKDFNYAPTTFSLLLTLFSVNSYAAITQANDAGFLYWPSRVSVEPSGGTITMAKGDGMFPLYGDNANSSFSTHRQNMLMIAIGAEQ
ncbi:MAG: hypothetical protein HWD59_01540 [Coxiellaceae bacterium]|nr:MAG: hypothetical protein HWD59_01540 [Coxiellaceae bacterium]